MRMKEYFVEKFTERICEWYEVDYENMIKDLSGLWEKSGQNKDSFLEKIIRGYDIPLEHLEEIWESVETNIRTATHYYHLL